MKHPHPTVALDEISAWLILLRAPGIGAAGLRTLIEYHHTALTAYQQATDTISELPEATLAYLRNPDVAALERDRAWLEQPQRHLVTWNSPDYPALLRVIPSAPAALFVFGQLDWLWSPQLAVVGSRNATAAGLATARSFAKTLAQSGIVITSGLADGIDGAAHRAALDASGASIAVMGTGPDLVYPRKHQELAEHIAAQGALVSEFPPGTPGRAEHFPRRNRIIAGLSLGTLVVEASLKSGSLITARLAADQGREVFAIPGSIHNPLARGCHQLIRNGAKLVETAAEVLEELGALAQMLSTSLRQRLSIETPANQPQIHSTDVSSHYDADYTKLLDALQHAPSSMDQLADRTGLSVAALSSMLLLLELDGVVTAERSGHYCRTPQPPLG